ncbi:hypothetical protein L1987_60833 [Smallanthus sonchifolius]|uniref:Uncharacterized protein n=1 Tax=Smallanthus sonchifolius TaxID=185202 RepID=A0ACB9D9C4_9ASTR|nr:hypothetical protein L1987_60833 [Smallanthus sonchifolius]
MDQETEDTIKAFAEGEYGVAIRKDDEAKVRPSATECKKWRCGGVAAVVTGSSGKGDDGLILDRRSMAALRSRRSYSGGAGFLCKRSSQPVSRSLNLRSMYLQASISDQCDSLLLFFLLLAGSYAGPEVRSCAYVHIWMPLNTISREGEDVKIPSEVDPSISSLCSCLTHPLPRAS